MPKGDKERRKSESKSSGSSQARSTKSERNTSFESSEASTVEEREGKESVSSAKCTSSSLSIESIVTEERESLSEDKATEIQESDTLESKVSDSGLLQPGSPEKTKVSPVKEFFSNLAQKFKSNLSKKSPPKPPPEDEEYVPGQELMKECIVQLPPKDKKTQTEKLTETRITTPRKRAAMFLSPETYEESDASTSVSTTADERDLITPSPTPRLDASKMTLAIKGHEPPKSEPGPFQKLRKLIGFEKEEKTHSTREASRKCEQEAKATQTNESSTISLEEVMALKRENCGLGSTISTSESSDNIELSQSTSQHSANFPSLMNLDTSGSSSHKSPVKNEAGAPTSAGFESLQLKSRRVGTERATSKKMPNPLIQMLRDEESENVEDEATPISPRKKECENFSKSLPFVQKQNVISEELTISPGHDEEMNIEESKKVTEAGDGVLALQLEPDIKGQTSIIPAEKVNLEASEAEDMVTESDPFVTSNQDEEMSVEKNKEMSGKVSDSDIDLSVSKNLCEEMNVEETSEDAIDKVAVSDIKESPISMNPGEVRNVEQISQEVSESCARVEDADIKENSPVSPSVDLEEMDTS